MLRIVLCLEDGRGLVIGDGYNETMDLPLLTHVDREFVIQGYEHVNPAKYSP